MKTMIFYKPTAKGIHSFFLKVNNEQYFLFSQAYRRGVDQYFRKGVRIEEAIDYSRSRRDIAIQRTMNKIPIYVRSVERECNLEVLKKTKRRNTRNDRKYCA